LVVSKLLERIVAHQLMAYLSTANLLPTLQSGYRHGDSTETAVLQVISELLQAVDRGEVGALILLDLTAAFDTIDHDILLWTLQQTFGIDGFGCISSVGRNTFVAVLSDHSSPVCCAVCRRDQFWDRCCSFCTPSTSFN